MFCVRAYIWIVLLSLVFVVVGCSPAAQAPALDGNNAFDMLKNQVDIGPRYPGSSGHDTAADYIVSQLKPYADSVTVQSSSQVVGGKTLEVKNIAAVFNPRARKWILLCAHWDSRPFADMEIDAAKKKMPILGANDGASGVAVLLELARAFSHRKPDVGVFMEFFDGEDYGKTEATMYLGSRHFAQNLATEAVVEGKPVKFAYGILLDMVGDKNLDIYEEPNSIDAAPEIVDKVWNMADRLGYAAQFIPKSGLSIDDDHIPLIKAGVKCIDVIDFNYGPWHTLDDTPDKCSAKSLTIVGDVVEHVVYAEKPE